MSTVWNPFSIMATSWSWGKKLVNQGRKKFTTRSYPDLLAVNDLEYDWSMISVPGLDPEQHFYKPPTKSSRFCLWLALACSLFLAHREPAAMSSTSLFVVNKKLHQVLVYCLIHGVFNWDICTVKCNLSTAAGHHKVLFRDMDRKIILSAFTQFFL